MSLKK